MAAQVDTQKMHHVWRCDPTYLHRGLPGFSDKSSGQQDRSDRIFM